MERFDQNIFGASAFEKRAREQFKKKADLLQAVGGDQTLNPNHPGIKKNRIYKPAAVLIPLIVRGDDASVLLTQRSEHLSSHSGQVAFPGGKVDQGESVEQAALRETREEVGLNSSEIELVGTFGTYYSGSGYSISPVLGVIRNEPRLTINHEEVAVAFEVPLSFLMNQQNHKRRKRSWDNQDVHFYAMPYRDDSVVPEVERNIWGVTAGIIRMVQERLYGAVAEHV